MRIGQRRVDRVDKRPELRRLCFDIDPHGELAERGAAHRADRSDERSAGLIQIKIITVKTAVSTC